MPAPTHASVNAEARVWVLDMTAQTAEQMTQTFRQSGLTTAVVDSSESLAQRLRGRLQPPAVLVLGGPDAHTLASAARFARESGYSGQLIVACDDRDQVAQHAVLAAGADAVVGRPISEAVAATLARSFGLPARG